MDVVEQQRFNGCQINRTAGGLEYAITDANTPGSETQAPEVVVCLHGIGGDYGSFMPQMEALGATWQMVAWCMPGYRKSIPLESVSFEALVDALEELRQHLGCTRFHLIGQSIGGMIAQQYTHRFPEHVISLCLIATTSAFGGRDDSFKREFLAARLKPLDQGLSMHELAVAFVPEITGPTVSEKCLASAITSMSAVPVNTYRQIMECLVTFDQRVQWPALSCPVCLIAGGVDTNAPSRTMRKMAERNPNAQFHEIRDAGHLVNLEMPDATNAIITRFLHDTVKVSHR